MKPKAVRLVEETAQPVLLARPGFTDEEIAAVTSVLRSGWIGPGPKTEAFETAFCAYVGAKQGVAVGSGGAALQLALQAMGIGPGHEVITTTMTFAATVNSILRVGARPVLVDVAPGSSLMDLNRVEAAISPATAAIIPVHLAGEPVDLNRLDEIRRKHGLKIIQDCAHAVESQWNGNPLGGWFDAACYSFNPTKNLTTIGGGMVCSGDTFLVERIRVLAQHGMSQDAWMRVSAGDVIHYDIVAAGSWSRLSDVGAALGLCQLKLLETRLERRTQIWRTYTRELAGGPFHLPPELAPEHRHARHLFTIRVDSRRTRLTRDEWILHLRRQGIFCGVHYRAIPQMSLYREEIGCDPAEFPHASAIGDTTLSLPLSGYLTDDEVARVLKAIALAA